MNVHVKAALMTSATLLGMMTAIALSIYDGRFLVYTMLAIMMGGICYFIYTGFLIYERRKEIDRKHQEAKRKNDERMNKLSGRHGGGVAK